MKKSSFERRIRLFSDASDAPRVRNCDFRMTEGREGLATEVLPGGPDLQPCGLSPRSKMGLNCVSDYLPKRSRLTTLDPLLWPDPPGCWLGPRHRIEGVQ